MKRALVGALTKPWMEPILSPLLRGRGAILMFHRFADSERGNGGHDVAQLRAELAALRRSGRELVSLDELVRRVRDEDMGDGSPIAFTIDDGYADFASVASPLFAEFDCPVTVFVVSGTLDQRGWYWWDRIAAALEQTSRRALELEVGAQPLSLAWTNLAERHRAEVALMEALKLVSDTERHAILDALPEALDVALPEHPPARFAAMTWDDVRRCASRGATFGAHTVSHPILSRVDDQAARDEIDTSWRRLRAETTATSDVFCYPNGRPIDFTPREPPLLKSLGFSAAVTTTAGYVGSADWRDPVPGAPYRLPRFGYPDDPAAFAQIVNGVARVKLAMWGPAAF